MDLNGILKRGEVRDGRRVEEDKKKRKKSVGRVILSCDNEEDDKSCFHGAAVAHGVGSHLSVFIRFRQHCC